MFSQGSEIKTVKVDYLYVYVHCIKACAAIANCLLIPTVKILVGWFKMLTCVYMCVQFLFNVQNTIHNSMYFSIFQLYHLLYWCNIPPAAALTYFYKPFSHHPITAQFANKVMHSFQPVSRVLRTFMIHTCIL